MVADEDAMCASPLSELSVGHVAVTAYYPSVILDTHFNNNCVPLSRIIERYYKNPCDCSNSANALLLLLLFEMCVLVSNIYIYL